ncbi:Cytochrome b [Pseudomonas guariconensis]|uniref:cytochrome b/b6 domain-containing protein n=1 Tax=Pseudomonas TaxID=286 RepID=UPI00088110D5|nr:MULTISPECIES: cytochrome b/b6 domain-containing protein [Pseudomonas]MDM9595824.1 cytochrome b/b6 domain-containing protein [Pseudomonas guariconensis]MDM9608654.1 cytochrome b/b6 domain-containing protein [Pseudomonas guariconensis]MDM9613611.1 cytochrome b/b6 domain-containing protein [Pseudomonas guariconensis]URD41947.1 cytochrome b/b6 domain-containing protein [Pseudomonas sp. BYT-5]URK97297.1 cytochrome b/b6 domain-containing protein [Pseudomonas sp. BYT-1]
MASVRLWDPLLRCCHWSLVFVFFANSFFNEEGDDWHQWLGYYALGVVIVRLVWGFVGPRSARWADFWPTPTRLAAHARALRRGEHYQRLGHTPIGALVMVLMLACVVGLGVTGWLSQEVDALWGVDWPNDVHSFLANALLALVCVHLLAALVESLRLKENLPLSMLTGRRRQPHDPR